ncbi:hypothetical protein CAC42_5382 [Sphaceloma murrayae]|uniref:Uncharacterized protein n=1 Tax=Sphaceloma murrayae TaxID=2082308 RepID=A0A2K1QVC6_9PEZI|nr:hypothetical protein CAC42_5382 [Sphaceloma murrayae]
MGHFKRASYDKDEELGKRDDNYRPWTAANTNKTPLRWRRRRLVIFIVVAFGVWLFIHNIPTDLGSIDSRLGRPTRPGHVIGGKDFGRAADAQQNVFRSAPRPPTGPPPRAESKGRQKSRIRTGEKLEEEEHYYSGPIKFYKLKASLDAIGTTGGHRMVNRNVLFAASRLKSAANLLPIACAMAEGSKNYVHLIFLGREALPVEDILKMNGITQKSCDVYFHDGRADYSEYSTDVRAEASVVGAMNHVNSWMHPQVVITDDEVAEDPFFTRGIRGKMKELERPVIELPRGRYDDFKWMTRLDSTSLSSWHKPRLELLVHDPPGAGGSLTRLLKSLADADLGGLKPPKLTVELPSKMDDFLTKFLKDFKWPPSLDNTRPESDLLKLQRRIPAASLGPEESAVRFVESYYPSHGFDDHVLILSPNAVVTPIFYHYVMFTLLSTRYSASSPDRERLAGLALTTSSRTLGGKQFVLPTVSQMRSKTTTQFEVNASPPFLYQVPQSSALLVFGDHWAEFHDYLTRRLHSLHAHPDSAKPRRMFDKTQPAWLEFFLELVRARSWAFLYPANSNDGSLTTIHRELYHPPEEYLDTKSSKPKADDASKAKSDEPYLTADEIPNMSPERESTAVSGSQSLHDILPFQGSLPDLSDLPLLSYSGENLGSLQDAEEEAVEYVKQLRQQLGGCSAKEADEPKIVRDGKTGDLFCYTGREAEEWEDRRVDMRMFNPHNQRDDAEDEESGKVVEDKKSEMAKNIEKLRDLEMMKDQAGPRGLGEESVLERARKEGDEALKKADGSHRVYLGVTDDGQVAGKEGRNLGEESVLERARKEGEERLRDDPAEKIGAVEPEEPVDEPEEKLVGKPMKKLPHQAQEIGAQ